jgi:PAS domain S-box-containing protein
MTGKIVSVNKAMESITGKTTDQLMGSDFSTYFIKPENLQSCYPDVLDKGFIGIIMFIEFWITVYMRH